MGQGSHKGIDTLAKVHLKNGCLNNFAPTHIRLTALCPGLPGWAGTRKVKPIWMLLEARDSQWQWHQLGYMQVCTSLQTDNHASTPPLSFLQAGCPSCRPTNSVTALKAKASTKIPHSRSGLYAGNGHRTVSRYTTSRCRLTSRRQRRSSSCCVRWAGLYLGDCKLYLLVNYKCLPSVLW